MSRKTTWKSQYIQSHDHLRALQSVAQSNSEFKKYRVDIGIGIGNFDTNLPWSELRALFRAASVPFPREWVTSKESLEELYVDEVDEKGG